MQALARSGFRVHPCNPETKAPYTKWTEMATNDPEQAAALFARFPEALIGVCTGGGLIVVDDDRGQAEPEEDMAKTRTVKTRSRGWHHWFRCSNPCIGNRVGIIPGVDIRGAGGYVIAPPSPGWEWWNNADMLELPDWVVTLMTSRAKRGRPWGTGFQPARTPVGEGGRNDYIARFAGYVLRLGLADSYAELATLCSEENWRILDPPLPDAEVAQTASSIFRTEQRRNG